MVLTQKAEAELMGIVGQLVRTMEFINSERIEVCVKGPATTTLHYTKAGDSRNGLSPIAKDIGSELCFLPTAINNLVNFIARNKKP